jgi:hypothetical protein
VQVSLHGQSSNPMTGFLCLIGLSTVSSVSKGVRSTILLYGDYAIFTFELKDAPRIENRAKK